MRGRRVAVVARTLRESASIAGQVSEFLGPSYCIETRTFEGASDDDARAAIVLGSGPDALVSALGRKKRHADVIPVRYNLTKWGWRKLMRVAKLLRGARVAVAGDTLGAAAQVSEAVRRLDLEGVTLEPVSEDTFHRRRFDFLLVADHCSGDISAGTGRVIEVGPLVLSPAVIVDLLCRLGRYDEAAKGRLAQYLNTVKLVRDDYTGLLDLAHFEGRRAMPPGKAGPDRKDRMLAEGAACSGAKYTLDDIVGQSRAIKEAKAIVERLHDSELSVVIYGETGTGKEMFAEATHNLSPRKDRHFVVMNCVAIPETLAESELFGYEEGAFTGAKKGGKDGLFERAHRGTIFLDEISDMSLGIQARLLRVLEDGRLLRVGGLKAREVDVRVIVATNRPLDELVKLGRFRQDLFFRLCVIPLRLPPLRERIEDIPLLIEKFLADMGECRKLSEVVLSQLMSYPWPGNVRELKHCLDYMRTVDSEAPELEHLPPHIPHAGSPATALGSPDRRWVALAGSGQPQAGYENRDGSGRGEIVAPTENDVSREDIFLLTVIDRFNGLGRGIGRRHLTWEARRYGVKLTEGEIRARLSDLRRRGLVKCGLGRSGTKLTAEGRSLLAKYREQLGPDRPWPVASQAGLS